MLEQRYMDGIKRSDPVDKEEREIFYFKISALKDIGAALTAIVENGKVEEANEIRKQKMNEGKTV